MMQADAKGGAGRSNRFLAGLPARLILAGHVHACTAHNLSRTGVLLVGDLPEVAESEIDLEIDAPGGTLRLDVRGRVIRVEKVPEGSESRLAFTFTALDEKQRGILEAMLARVLEALAPPLLETLRPGMPPHEIRKTLEEIPLPHRIAAAARGTPREREFLRQDPHPQVLEALARNPNLLPAEALALAGTLALLPTTLEILANDPRWAGDEEIQIRIAAHTRVPVPLAERIIAGMKPLALQKLIQKPSLNPLLRDGLVRRMKRVR